MIPGPFQRSDKIQIVWAQHIFTFPLNPLPVLLRQRVKFYALHTLRVGSCAFAYQLRVEQRFQAGLCIMYVTESSAKSYHSGDSATGTCQRTKRDEELLNRFF